MLKNYFKIAWRNLVKHKRYSSINIIGLATGIAVALLIALWVWDEVTFDSYHKNHTRLAQVMDTEMNNGEKITSGKIAIPLRYELQNKYGDNFKKFAITSQTYPFVIGVGEKKISQTGMFVEPSFPHMFTLNIQSGSAGVLNDPSSVMISRSLASALFGDADPINKAFDVSGKFTAKVAAVYEDLPQSSTFSSIKLLLSWDKLVSVAGFQKELTDWRNHSFNLYLQLNESADFEKTTEKIKRIVQQNNPGSKEEILLHPMDKWHLYSDFTNGKVTGGRIQFVWLFAIIGLFVLLLACINFMNLSTARSTKRAKEMGIRKVVGSLRWQLIGQFLMESLLMTVLAAVVALGLLYLSLPFFNSLADKQMAIPWGNFMFWLLMLSFILFTGLVSGSYPAFYLSGFQPIKVLKGIFKAGPEATIPRKVLVTLQFTVSVALITGTLIVFKQVQHAKDRPVGYSRAGLISLTLFKNNAFRYYEPFREELLRTNVVSEMSESSSSSTHVWNSYGNLNWAGKDPRNESSFGMVAVTHDFGKTVGWNIKEGRDFSRNFLTDTGTFIINEAAAKVIGFKHPVGNVIKWEGKDHIITGVVKDLVIESPFTSVKPTVFFLDYERWLQFVLIKIKPTMSTQQALATIEPVFKKYNSGRPFDYQFIEDEYAKKFSDEQRIGALASIFAALAILISCLGLFGLVSFIAEQRMREIGVRKVLGASLFNLWSLLSKEFLVLVGISFFMAVPIAWYFLNQWLQQYEYRTKLSWWFFIEAGLGVLLITLVTVSYQTIKAAIASPIKSLRSE